MGRPVPTEVHLPAFKLQVWAMAPGTVVAALACRIGTHAAVVLAAYFLDACTHCQRQRLPWRG